MTKIRDASARTDYFDQIVKEQRRAHSPGDHEQK
jgi:hypothetical protein